MNDFNKGYLSGVLMTAAIIFIGAAVINFIEKHKCEQNTAQKCEWVNGYVRAKGISND